MGVELNLQRTGSDQNLGGVFASCQVADDNRYLRVIAVENSLVLEPVQTLIGLFVTGFLPFINAKQNAEAWGTFRTYLTENYGKMVGRVAILKVRGESGSDREALSVLKLETIKTASADLQNMVTDAKEAIKALSWYQGVLRAHPASQGDDEEWEEVGGMAFPERITKKDGSVVPFAWEKIVKGFSDAGFTPGEGQVKGVIEKVQQEIERQSGNLTTVKVQEIAVRMIKDAELELPEPLLWTALNPDVVAELAKGDLPFTSIDPQRVLEVSAHLPTVAE